MQMAVGRTLRDEPDRLRGRVARERLYLHVEHGGQAAEALRADAERVDLLVELETHLLEPAARAAGAQLAHVDRLHQRALGHHHRVFGRAADAEPDQPRRTPAGAETLERAQHPFYDVVRWLQRGEARLVLRAAALGRDMDLDRVARDHFDMQHVGRRVVAGVDLRANTGSTTIEARSGFASTIQAPPHGRVDEIVLQRAPCGEPRADAEACTKTLTTPVSWQIGLCPIAAMRELMRICAMAFLAASLSSRS